VTGTRKWQLRGTPRHCAHSIADFIHDLLTTSPYCIYPAPNTCWIENSILYVILRQKMQPVVVGWIVISYRMKDADAWAFINKPDRIPARDIRRAVTTRATITTQLCSSLHVTPWFLYLDQHFKGDPQYVLSNFRNSSSSCRQKFSFKTE
jgi:hypothetical protein